jgi:hypothetical protein
VPRQKFDFAEKVELREEVELLTRCKQIVRQHYIKLWYYFDG